MKHLPWESIISRLFRSLGFGGIQDGDSNPGVDSVIKEWNEAGLDVLDIFRFLTILKLKTTQNITLLSNLKAFYTGHFQGKLVKDWKCYISLQQPLDMYMIICEINYWASLVKRYKNLYFNSNMVIYLTMYQYIQYIYLPTWSVVHIR